MVFSPGNERRHKELLFPTFQLEGTAHLPASREALGYSLGLLLDFFTLYS
jgi:hypothetical protein